jgi:hypothetical protein
VVKGLHFFSYRKENKPGLKLKNHAISITFLISTPKNIIYKKKENLLKRK